MWRLLPLFLCLPISLHAATMRITPDSLPVSVDSPVSFAIEADMQGEVVNAVEASFVYDETFLRFEEGLDTESRMLFWVTYPDMCGRGKICLSGITPGGFAGNAQNIASLSFIPLKAGTTTLSLLSPRLLRHDGKGTDINVTAESIQIVIEESLGDEAPSKEPLDTEPPEVFTPKLIADPSVYDGHFVLVFDTKDKQTKVVSYLIREFRHPLLAWFAEWNVAESPYLLEDQSLSSHIEVKAIDSAGNERVMKVLPQAPVNYVWSLVSGIGLGLGLFVGFVIYFKKRRR
jgi:hypothetical protein